MTINNRMKLLRNELGLNQDTFGNKINLTKFAISNYENGRTGIPDRVINDICREFGVNEEWIRDGTGEMFEQLTDQEKLLKYTALLLKGKDSAVVTAIQALIITYEQLDDDSKATLEKIALQYISNLKKSQ